MRLLGRSNNGEFSLTEFVDETIENPRFCWKCQALLNSQCPDNVVYKLGATLEGKEFQSRTLKTTVSIEKTAHEGCYLCQHLVHTMSDTMLQALRVFKKKNVVFTHSLHLEEGRPGSLSMFAESDEIAKELDTDEIKCFINLHPKSKLEDSLNHEEIGLCTGAMSTLSLIANWLGRCASSHERCRKATKDSEYSPSRIIDITPENPPRLLVVGKSNKVKRYTTLSHCWGSHMPLKLLSSNIATLQEKISYSSLTKTFQDAITVSRRLGVYYIWIDSLCIVQDSEKDWQEQSANMASVYSNSYCNIAAAHAKDGTGGCFVHRDPNIVKPLKVDLNWGPGPGSYYAIQSGYLWDNLLGAPLNMRAWVFQERTLAPRNLFFCCREVFFQCHEIVASEAFPEQLPPQIGTVAPRGIRPQLDGPDIRIFRGLEPSTSLNAYSVWGWLVDSFSIGNLTYTTDKLVAFSAIASKMQHHIQSEYLAGLWRQYLPYQLLWEVRGIQWLVRRGRSSEYIAPTWSWASVTGSVENACDVRFSDERDIIIKVLDVHVKLVNDLNVFGQVKGGHLRIQGYLAKLGLYIHTSKSGSQYLQVRLGKEARSTIILDNGNDESKSVSETFYFLPIQCLPHYEETTFGGVSMALPQVSGIILRPTSISKEEYVRVGKFEYFGDSRDFQLACCQLTAQVGEAEIEGWGQRKILTIV